MLRNHKLNLPTHSATVTEQIFVHELQAHYAGSLSRAVLEAIELLSPDTVNHSVETGCGRSTLLLSNKSENHLIFCLDDTETQNSSVSYVQNSSIFKKENTEFIFGPTQKSLLNYSFQSPIDIAIIDGPHGYPFPDLEYFSIYPHLRENALLIIDDLHIPTIRNLFEVLVEDEMFDLEGVVGTTGFLRRTNSYTHNPYQDGWNWQNYNSKKIREFLSYFYGQPSSVGLPLTINFCSPSSNSNEFCSYGWSSPSEQGAFTIGSKASLIINIDRQAVNQENSFIFSFSAKAFLDPQAQVQDIVISVNGNVIVEWHFDNEDLTHLNVEIPREILLKKSPIEVHFRVKQPLQPAAENDWCRLGLVIAQLSIYS